MNRPLLTLADLVAGLNSHGDRYGELAVFANDLAEVKTLEKGEVPDGVVPVDAEGKTFFYTHEGALYRLQISEDGFARISRRGATEARTDVAGPAVVGALAGTAIGSAVSKKGEGWAAGLVLGLLAGAMLGSGGERPARRVLTMRFDPDSRSWCAYDGGLVAWMKSELQPQP
jgi:hypothetical protein